MEKQAWPQYAPELCASLEIDHFEDEDVKEILRDGVTPSHLLEAATLIRQKENSPILKLNLEIESDEDVEHIEDLQQVLEIACASGTMRVTLDCIENARTESVMLKVQAPFSALMMLIGSNRTFKWLCAYPKEMHRALRELTEKTAEFCIEAINRGTPIISLADPSGMLELLGEKRYKEFCAFYVICLLRRLEPYLNNAVVHICPRTSLLLERFQLLHAEMEHDPSLNYVNAVLECTRQPGKQILGHRCINAEYAEDDRIYPLHLNAPQLQLVPMEKADWEAVSRIYGAGIQTKNVTIVQEVPELRQWLAGHTECVVAKYLGNVIGFASLGKQPVPELSVYVEKIFQRLGVGTQLLKDLQSRAAGTLRSLIFAANTPSIQLHEKNGFRKTGEFRFAGDTRQVLVYEWEPGQRSGPEMETEGQT